MFSTDTYRRVAEALHRPSYLVPTGQVHARYRVPLARLSEWMARPDFDGELAMAMIQRWRDEGVLDDERMWSAMSVVCTHPRVRQYREAARCIALQENAAMTQGGERLEAAMASVERHRGVLAFAMGRYEVALECFIRALERERTDENLGNVLVAMVRTGDVEQAEQLLEHVREHFPGDLTEALERRIDVDEDLEILR